MQTPSSNNTKEDSTYGHNQKVNSEIRLIIFSAAEDGEALYSQQKQDLELTVAQLMNTLLQNSDLKKVGETTRQFRYDLNQIPYNYTVEVTNRFKEVQEPQRRRFHPCVQKILWRRKWQPISVFLPGKSHGQRRLADYSLWGHKESDMTEPLCTTSMI